MGILIILVVVVGAQVNAAKDQLVSTEDLDNEIALEMKSNDHVDFNSANTKSRRMSTNAIQLYQPLPADLLLKLYAYFKIVKVGENKARMPKNMFSPAEVKKHYAWKKLGKMTADEAMQAYVALVQSKLEN